MMLLSAALLFASLLVPPITGPATSDRAPSSHEVGEDRTARLLGEVLRAVPEADSASRMQPNQFPPVERRWLDRVQDERQAKVAIVTLLAYRDGARVPGRRDHAIPLGVAALAAQIVAGGVDSSSKSEKDYYVRVPRSAGRDQRASALRALEWAGRLGICGPDFVRLLNGLPLGRATPDGEEPDLRRVTRDLGVAAYGGIDQCSRTREPISTDNVPSEGEQ